MKIWTKAKTVYVTIMIPQNVINLICLKVQKSEMQYTVVFATTTSSPEANAINASSFSSLYIIHPGESPTHMKQQNSLVYHSIHEK